MGYSSYLEVWPASLAAKIRSDSECWTAFRCMWGHGSGMHAWFRQIDPDEIDQICEGVPRSAVDRLRRLLEDAERLPAAFLGKTHDIHESILRSAFGALRLADAAVLARVAVYGEEPLGASTGFRTVGPDRSSRLTAALMEVSVSAVVDDFDLGDREPEDTWREDLKTELQDLVDLYRAASQHGHHVLTGDP